MGTRSLTHIQDSEGKIFVTMYRQFDGYLDGHGKALADFIAKGRMVNGYGDDPNVFNGMGCFAMQLLHHLKESCYEHDKEMHEAMKKPGEYVRKPLNPGNFYLRLPGTTDCGEEFVYFIKPVIGKETEGNMKQRRIFDSPISSLALFVREVYGRKYKRFDFQSKKWKVCKKAEVET